MTTQTEDQIRYRFAVWLLTVEDYLVLKFQYKHQSEDFIFVEKYTTDRHGNTASILVGLKESFIIQKNIDLG